MDDSVSVRLLQELECGPVVNDFVNWCYYLKLNVTKTKDTVVDFRRTNPSVDTTVRGQNVVVVESYKYLGTIIDKDLSLSEKTEAL